MRSIISQIETNDKYVDVWIEYGAKVYYVDGNPYGLIATLDRDSVLYIYSRTVSNSSGFSIGMLRDIISYHKGGNICLVTDSEEYMGSVKKSLDRYGFRYEYVDGLMYSYNVRS